MEKYKLILGKDCAYTIPKENIGMLAYSKGYKGNIFDLDNAIKYLESLGVKFEEV